MGEVTYTPDPADVELVADALARRYSPNGLTYLEAVAPGGAEPERSDARAVLAALAAAGCLSANAEAAASSSVASALMAARDDLARIAERLRTKARETGDRTHHGTAAGVSLACFRLMELADRAASASEGSSTSR